MTAERALQYQRGAILYYSLLLMPPSSALEQGTDTHDHRKAADLRIPEVFERRASVREILFLNHASASRAPIQPSLRRAAS